VIAEKRKGWMLIASAFILGFSSANVLSGVWRLPSASAVLAWITIGIVFVAMLGYIVTAAFAYYGDRRNGDTRISSLTWALFSPILAVVVAVGLTIAMLVEQWCA
jgi:hypothetical protein